MQSWVTESSSRLGEQAVYPRRRGRVIRIEEKDIAGTRQRFYVFAFSTRTARFCSRLERECRRSAPGH